MKLLYKPFGIIAGVIGAKVGPEACSNAVGSGRRQPAAEARGPERRPSARVVAAQRAGGGDARRRGRGRGPLSSMRWFHYLTGIWPGDKNETDEADGRGVSGAGP